ncbi:unnamed protein product [Phytophthora fragariaefolia]|uniref:Unnamed protein product n=1 Tax=Phytophthora fragariaefolia TaxID=1490495 RepID=A0A9W6XKU7_9STRA|nr:unnamed protein product [Phytophthora fragariaefolia]
MKLLTVWIHAIIRSLEYTHTQAFPPWAKDFTQLEFLYVVTDFIALRLGSYVCACLSRHVENIFFSPMIYMPDDLFKDMASLTFIHFATFIPMTKLPSFDGLTNLKSLTLAAFLFLEELPAFDSLHKLERLVLASLPRINTLPDFGAINNLQSFTAFDRGAWCCNGFLGKCDLNDDKCGAHPVWKTPNATCLAPDSKATEATVKSAQKFANSICGPILRPEAVQGAPTKETMAVCKGIMYRQCNKPNEPEAICYNARFMGITCTPSPYVIEMRRRQIAQNVGDRCDPDVEAWLGCDHG